MSAIVFYPFQTHLRDGLKKGNCTVAFYAVSKNDFCPVRSIDEYTSLKNWDDCLRIAFLHLPFPGQHEKILNSWIPKLDRNIRFADVVLFYIVRSLPFGKEVSREWISACADLATSSRNESLVESLIWVLRSDVNKHEDLWGVAQNLSATSFKVKKALMKTGNFQ